MSAKSPRYLLNPLLVFFLSLEMTLHFQPPKFQIHSHDCQPRPQVGRAHLAASEGGIAPSSSLLWLCRKTEEASPLEICSLSMQIQQQRSSLGTNGQSLLSAFCIFPSFPSLPVLDRSAPGLCRGKQLLSLPLSKQDFSRGQSVCCTSFDYSRATLGAQLPGYCKP